MNPFLTSLYSADAISINGTLITPVIIKTPRVYEASQTLPMFSSLDFVVHPSDDGDVCRSLSYDDICNSTHYNPQRECWELKFMPLASDQQAKIDIRLFKQTDLYSMQAITDISSFTCTPEGQEKAQSDYIDTVNQAIKITLPSADIPAGFVESCYAESLSPAQAATKFQKLMGKSKNGVKYRIRIRKDYFADPHYVTKLGDYPEFRSIFVSKHYFSWKNRLIAEKHLLDVLKTYASAEIEEFEEENIE